MYEVSFHCAALPTRAEPSPAPKRDPWSANIEKKLQHETHHEESGNQTKKIVIDSRKNWFLSTHGPTFCSFSSPESSFFGGSWRSFSSALSLRPTTPWPPSSLKPLPPLTPSRHCCLPRARPSSYSPGARSFYLQGPRGRRRRRQQQHTHDIVSEVLHPSDAKQTNAIVRWAADLGAVCVAAVAVGLHLLVQRLHGVNGAQRVVHEIRGFDQLLDPGVVPLRVWQDAFNQMVDARYLCRAQRGHVAR